MTVHPLSDGQRETLRQASADERTAAARTYPATVLEVVDGDTAKFAVHLRRRRAKDADYGFHVHSEGPWLTVHESMRFLGINAPEHATVAGDAATAFLRTLLSPGQPVTVQTVLVASQDKQEKYGRFLATVLLADGTNVNEAMVAAGHAAPWDGHGQRPLPK